MSPIEEALRNAAHEIRDLRRRNEILDAKVSVMDLFALVLNTRPAYPTQGMGEDVAWACDKLATELEHQRTAPQAPSKP